MEMGQPALNLGQLSTSLEPGGIVHLFKPYLKELPEDATGDQAEGFAKMTINNIHCSPFACTDSPHVLEYNEVGWAQLRAGYSRHVLVLHMSFTW